CGAARGRSPPPPTTGRPAGAILPVRRGVPRSGDRSYVRDGCRPEARAVQRDRPPRRAAGTSPRPSRGVRYTRPGASAPGPTGGVPGTSALSSFPHGDTTSNRYSTAPALPARLRGALPPMLTPAEELGLSGHNLAGRVRKAFYQIPEATLRELL